MSARVLTGLVVGILSILLTVLGYSWTEHVTRNDAVEDRVDRLEDAYARQGVLLEQMARHLESIDAQLRRR